MRIVEVLIVGVILLTLAISCSSSGGLEDKILGLQDAINSHNSSRIGSFYADSVIFQVAGGLMIQGKNELLKYEEWNKAVNTQWSFQNIIAKGDTVFCKLIDKNRWYELADIDSVIYSEVSYVFYNKKIISVILEVSKESEQAIKVATQTIQSWAYENSRRQLEELAAGGNMKYDTETADKWMQLIRDWRQGTGMPEK